MPFTEEEREAIEADFASYNKAKYFSVDEVIDTMRRCSSEIKQLRSVIAALQPKADAYDNLAAVIRMLPRPPQGYGEDLAWQLDRRVDELTAVKTEKKDNG